MGNFSENIVNQQFNKLYKLFEKEGIIKGKSDLAEKLDTYNHVINNILKGDRNITVDQLNKLFLTYNVNANYLFGLSEQIFMDGHAPGSIPIVPMEKLATIGKNNILFVRDRKALAGNALDVAIAPDEEVVQRFSVPGLEGELFAIEIDGDSMMPTITNGDLLICERMQRGEPLRDNQVYVIVTDVVVTKRIQQVKNQNALRLISDNDAVYKPYMVPLNEIQQILRVKCRMTSYGIG